MNRLTRRAAACLLALALVGPALANPCYTSTPEGGVPARVRVDAGDMGTTPEACPATAVSVDTQLGLLIALDDYYGNVYVGATVRGRLALTEDFWVSLWMPGVDWRFAANASLEATSLDLGATTLGFHAAYRLGADAQLAPYLRVLLPTETVYGTALRSGFEFGASGVFRVHPVVDVVAGLSLPVLISTVGDTSDTRLNPQLSLDLSASPLSWLAFTMGAALRVEDGEDGPVFESLDPRLALRFYPTGGLLIEVAAATPILGRDRTDALATLSLGWIFEADE